ncbi:acetyl-CoA hydrolase/transferase C-terminal domain-containing protein [Halorarius halobius]|uniref:acetyl-CoA hydrolase/transferase C-terminal domain-containing protein n=1 Tax=Halorarius halobius TaxID=2962671 RepID=UPI0020CF65F4|nr:acetyl-CoA hydrolase/transferase C-terminal domain-containing protein [Halorarius halobius]
MSRIEAGVPVRAAESVAAAVEPGTVLGVSGFGSVGYPKAVPLALAERGDAADLGLTVVSGGNVGAEIDETLMATGAIARRYPYQGSDEANARVNDGRLAFHDRHVSQVADELLYGGLPAPDLTVVEAVAVGDGWLAPSTSLGATPALVEAADRLVVEVNDAQPRGLEALHDVYRPGAPPGRDPIPLTEAGERIGDTRVAFDPGKLDAVVRVDRPDATYEFRDPTAEDRQVAANLANFLSEEIERNPALAEAVNLQFGVGSVGNAAALAIEDVAFGDREVAYVGEVIQDSVLDAVDAGGLTAASATSLALSAEGQNRLFGDLDHYAERVVLRPSDVSNAPGVVRRFGVVAVNAAVEVDLTGHVNSTHLRGTRMVNGIGGSGDFTRSGLVSVVAVPSTAAGGDASRVVPMATHVDHTEHDAGVVVTEHGVADLRGLSPRERAREMVDVAHPAFRPALDRYLERGLESGGHTPHDLETAFDPLERE